jgi:xanthine dehydrogenase YagT iron-sulfur-binding subunit
MRFIKKGKQLQASAGLRRSLPNLLRDHLGSVGARKGCNQGACGSRIVPIDGKRINVSLALAVPYRNRDIVNFERLAQKDNRLNGSVHPLPASTIANSFPEMGMSKTRWSALNKTIRDTSHPGLRSPSPRLETTSL